MAYENNYLKITRTFAVFYQVLLLFSITLTKHMWMFITIIILFLLACFVLENKSAFTL